MQFGSAISENESTTDAIEELLAAARETGIDPDLVFLFFTAHHSDEAAGVVEKLWLELDPQVMLGCSGEGVIGGDTEVERAPAVSILFGQLAGVRLHPFHISSDEWREIVADPEELRTRIAHGDETRAVIGFGDPFTSATSQFLAAMDDQLAPLLTALLSGLAEAGEHKFIGEYIGKFIEEGRFLYQILFFVRAPATRNNAVLARTTERAASLGELGTLIEAVNVAAEIHATDPGTLIEDVFMPAVDALAAAKRPDWVKGAWAARHTASIIIALNEEQSNRLLESFSSIPEVDYNADNFLAAVAGTHLDLVLDFFAKRLRMDRKEFDGRFSPIPFNLHALKAALSRHPDRVFDACRRWYADDSLLHEYRGGKLLKNVFPDLDKHVAETLIQIVRVGERDDLKFVLATLKAYEGKEAIYPICMEVVERLESGDEMLNSVSDTLAVTGVMLGEFGYVEAQAQQKALIDAWAGDERPKVRDYAAMLSRRLAQGMAFEQRMAEREIEGRRREYGEA